MTFWANNQIVLRDRTKEELDFESMTKDGQDFFFYVNRIRYLSTITKFDACSAKGSWYIDQKTSVQDNVQNSFTLEQWQWDFMI